jgi:peroxiredoxin
MQLGKLHRVEAPLIELGYQVIAISPDRPENLRQTGEKHQFQHLLLSDSSMAGARAFGIAWQVNDKTPDYYLKLERASGDSHHQLPVPSVFIIDTGGVIQFQYVNPDHTIRLDPDVLLAAAKAAMEEKAKKD